MYVNAGTRNRSTCINEFTATNKNSKIGIGEQNRKESLNQLICICREVLLKTP